MSAAETSEPMPLRRAKYVTVEEMVLSHYTIDWKRYENEVAKLSAPELTKSTGSDCKLADPGHHNVSNVRELSNVQSNNTREKSPLNNDLCVVSHRSPLHTKHHSCRLQPPRDGFNLCLLVGKLEVVVDKYRVDGSRILVAEAEVGDESGSISLRARDEQIDLIREVTNRRDAVVLRNCTLELYQGKHLRLGVTKWGNMRVYPDGIESTPSPPTHINRDRNFSVVNLNLVATSKMLDNPPIPVATVHHKQQKQLTQTGKSHGDSLQRSDAMNPGRAQSDTSQKKKQNESQQHQHRRGSNTIVSAERMHSPQRHRIGGTSSPRSLHAAQIYQQPEQGDLYSYPTHQDPNHSFLPDTRYSSQQHFIYQQFHDMQQRHTHQMILLQQQQELQLRELAQSSISPNSRVDSLEARANFSTLPATSHFNTSVYPRPPNMHSYMSAPFPHSPHPQDYHYGPMITSSVRNCHQVNEQQGGGEPTTCASVISPPMSPKQSPSHEPPKPHQSSGDNHT